MQHREGSRRRAFGSDAAARKPRSGVPALKSSGPASSRAGPLMPCPTALGQSRSRAAPFGSATTQACARRRTRVRSSAPPATTHCGARVDGALASRRSRGAVDHATEHKPSPPGTRAAADRRDGPSVSARAHRRAPAARGPTDVDRETKRQASRSSASLLREHFAEVRSMRRSQSSRLEAGSRHTSTSSGASRANLAERAAIAHRLRITTGTRSGGSRRRQTVGERVAPEAMRERVHRVKGRPPISTSMPRRCARHWAPCARARAARSRGSGPAASRRASSGRQGTSPAR